MPKMFRLVKGELSKLLLRPIMYAMVILLVGALVVTFISFNIGNKSATTNHYTSTDFGNNQAVVQHFNTTNNYYGKIETDKMVNESVTKLDFYTILSSDDPSTIKTKNDLVSQASQIDNTYTKGFKQYLKDGKVNFNSEKATACYNAVNTLIEQVGDFDNTYSTVINYSTPVAFVNKTEKDDTKALIATMLDYLQPSTPYTPSSSYEVYNNLQELIDNKNIPQKLIMYVKNIEDVQNKIKEEDLTEAKQIVTNAQAYLAELNTKINTYSGNPEISLEQAKADADMYYTVGLQVNDYVQNLLLHLSLAGMSDSKINSLYTSGSLFDSDDVYMYKIDEKLTYNKYLLTQTPIMASTNYSSAFSTSISSGENVSAFDFTYYGLGVCSVIVIIFCIIIGAGMVAGEHTNGTLRMLMIRPFSRNKIISSKIISTVLLAFLFILFATLILFISGAIMYGVNLTPILFVLNANTVIEMSPILYLIIYILLLTLKIYIYCLIAIAISVLFKSNIAAVLVSVLLYIITIIFGVAFSSSMWLTFLPAGNFDIFKYFGGSLVNTQALTSLSTPVLHGSSLIFSVIYTIVIIIALEFLTHFVFKRREIK